MKLVYDLKLTNSGDLEISEDGDVSLTQSVRQAVLIRLRWLFGEWRFAPENGVPYFQKIMVKNPDIPRIKQIIRDEKFEPNHKKTRFINEYGRKIITGVSVSSGAKLTIPKARKREIRKNVYFILTKGLAEHQRRIGSSDPVYLKRLIGELCYWRSIEPDNAYVSDSINRLKCLEKGY